MHCLQWNAFELRQQRHPKISKPLTILSINEILIRFFGMYARGVVNIIFLRRPFFFGKIYLKKYKLLAITCIAITNIS